MAVAKSMGAGERRVLYGANVIFAVLFATAILVVVIVLARQLDAQADLTRSGFNSLSDRSLKLLSDLDEDLTITAIYPVTDADETTERRADAVQDLLALYENAAGGQVSVAFINSLQEETQVQAFAQRLREKPAFQAETEPYRAALTEFASFATRLQDQLAGDFETLQNASRQSGLAENRDYASVMLSVRQLREEARASGEVVTRLQDDTLPQYGVAVDDAQSLLTLTQTMLSGISDWMLNREGRRTPLAAPVESMFEQQAASYGALVDEARTVLTTLQNLPPLEFDKLISQLNNVLSRPPIVIETSETAAVVPFEDMFAPRTDPNMPATGGPDPNREFVGEQGISSAILQLTQAERTGVVFVRFGGQPLLEPDFASMNPMAGRLPQAPFQGLNEVLQQENFVTAEWDLRASPEPPVLEGVVRRVYVVLPPSPPEQPDPRRPPTEPGITSEDTQILIEAVNESGMALFLAGAQPASPMMPMSSDYAYADFLREQWGVDVLYRYIAMVFVPSPQDAEKFLPINALQRGTSPVELRIPAQASFTDAEITAPLGSSQGVLSLVSPLRLLDEPAAVTHVPLVRVPATERVWALRDLQQLQQALQEEQGVRPSADAATLSAASTPTGDVLAPFPVAVAATNDADQKLVLISSTDFASDQYAQAMGLGQSGGQLVSYPLYPANRDFFINCLHWLTGNANRIAVGPQRGTLPVLDQLEQDDEPMIAAFIVGVWPALALLAGGVVWLFRRR